MTATLLGLAALLCLQTPDGTGPAIQDPAIQSLGAKDQPAPESQPTRTREVEAEMQPWAPAPSATPAPAAPQPAPAPPAAAPAAQEPAPAAAETAPAAQTKPETPAGAGDLLTRAKKDHFSGLIVSGVGGAVMAVGVVLAGVAGTLAVLRLPFPGGTSERTGATNSAVVGAVFCSLVGAVLVAVGVALVGISYI